ncbi:hypothetical protein [Reichenbachiella sp.]|uniref:hypothetical protein n=1 Tax=Reichenbachiella sp. TaxID=2184521 RepID=UPI003BAFFC0F
MKIRLSILFLMIVLGTTTRSFAQSDSLKIEKRKSPLGIKGYIGGVYENATVAPDHTKSFGVQAAVILKNHIEVGFYNLAYTNNNYRERLIFPNIFQMNYKHAGFVLGYRTNLEKDYEFNVESKVGFGEVKWAQVETGDAFLVDKFSILQLQISVDYLLANFLALNAFVGYRWMKQLEITGLENEDFNGVYFGLAVKVGKF